MLHILRSKNIRNIFIFVCDSLRWDYTPTRIIQKGITFKTIASSLYTAPSFASIISGVYPPRHGVDTWEDILPNNKRGLLTIDGYNISLWCETTWIDQAPNESSIHQILGNPPGISLEEIFTPFIYIEDDKGGHCPYGLPFEEFGGGGCPKFYKEYAKKGREALIKQYKEGIRQSIQRFEKRLEILKKRGIIDNTLVIFTSDHGELLGEYGGLTGHGRPACPELVYVPTIFIHPSLKTKEIKEGVMRHVDLYPTIAGILNIKVPYKTDGVNLLNQPYPKIGLSFRKGGFFKTGRIKKFFRYSVSSAWDYYGGHIFHELGLLRGSILFFYNIFVRKSKEFCFLIESTKIDNFFQKTKKYLSALKHLSFSYLEYSHPQCQLSKNKALRLINDYLQKVGKIEKEGQDIDEEIRKKLKALGYMD